MKQVHSAFLTPFIGYLMRLATLSVFLVLSQATVKGQTFHFPSQTYLDTLRLRDIVMTPTADTLTVVQGDFNLMNSATSGGNGAFTIKSIHAIANLKVDVQSPEVVQKQKFTYLITYRTIGTPNPAIPGATTMSQVDTLSVSYDRDSLKLINDRAFKIAGKFHKLQIIIDQVFEYKDSSIGPVYTLLQPGVAYDVPTFVFVTGEIQVQKYISHSSLAMGTVSKIDNISVDGTVLLDWSSPPVITPAGYEVEWTYSDPYTAQYDFRYNATRVFTNNTFFKIPVATREGKLIYRVRMVRPDLNNLLARNYGPWTLPNDQGNLSAVTASTVQIPKTLSDSLNWDLKMSFVEDGKYKQVLTYYDGLLKPKQVQTRFNSRPDQKIVAQSLFDYEGRPVINSLPIPVEAEKGLSYVRNFLRPEGEPEFQKSMYDSIPNPDICPPREFPLLPLDTAAPANKYYTRFKIDQSGKNAFLPDAENYPLVRKVIAAENSDKVLFEGQAGKELQLGNDRHTSYLYGSPLQAELNKYFGQDIGKYNYFRKMITTDNHLQDMFSISDDEGRPVISGLIGSPDTNSLALSVRNAPASDSFKSNLLPVPNIKMGDVWFNNGSYFVERQANYSFEYRIDYHPFQPCVNIPYRLQPKVYYEYEVFDDCGNLMVEDSGTLGTPGVTTTNYLTHSHSEPAFLKKGNHVWTKNSYIKLKDVAASVDAYLGLTDGCFLTYNDFFKKEFIESQFPCETNPGPCDAMRLKMIKELYPDAKYGKYNYADSVSKTFSSGVDNSIFTIIDERDYRYRDSCVVYPDTVIVAGVKYWDIRSLDPQQLIDIFNDTIAAALLPLHPDYCKLQLCDILTIPYDEYLKGIKTKANAEAVNRFQLSQIINNDPLKTNGILGYDELSVTLDGDMSLDSMAFKKTICGSEFGIVESVCGEINAGKDLSDLINYPQHLSDEYYVNLIEQYIRNRDARIGKYLNEMEDDCGPCSELRMIDENEDATIAPVDDTTFFMIGMDSVSTHLALPGNINSIVTSPSTFNADSLNNFMNIENSYYCTYQVERILERLVDCDVPVATLNKLRDTLERRFCTEGNSILSISYDSLNTILTQVGIGVNDLCNAGLIDLRKMTRSAGDHIQKGLLQHSPSYYSNLATFMQSQQMLGFIAGGSSSVNVTLRRCDSYPFEKSLAGLLGSAGTASCTSTLQATVTKTIMSTENAVRLRFAANGNQIDYFLYPGVKDEVNALNSSFGVPVISNFQNYQVKPLFNLYGFDQLSNAFANRNTVFLRFTGTQNGVQRQFHYLLSAFEEQFDYVFMERDQKEFLNGVSCSEFAGMAEEVIADGIQLNIKVGHPKFETWFTNMVNYKNQINFDFDSYYTSLEACALTDSILIPKVMGHFRVRMPMSANIETYLDNVTILDTIGIARVEAYEAGGYKYLVVDVTEANGRSILDAKKSLNLRKPSGAAVQYLPSLQRDTLAVLLSSNYSPVDSFSLNASFPGATIASHVTTLHYYIPGYGYFQHGGKVYYIKKSISDDFDYNHYVDSVLRFASLNAPMTPVFTHAESAVSAQYHDWQMQAWRSYVKSLSDTNHNQLVKLSKAANFNSLSASSGGISFANSKFSYKNALRPYYLNDLYIDHTPTDNSDFDYIRQLLVNLETYNYNTSQNRTPLKEYGHQNPILSIVANTETRTYVCADTTVFWINHFDTGRAMINLFIKMPDFLVLPRTSYKIYQISKGFERDSVTYINLSFVGSLNGVNDTISCVGYANRKFGENYVIPGAFLASHGDYAWLTSQFENCETRKIQTLRPAAQINYGLYIDSIRTDLIGKFRSHIIDSLQESLNIRGNDIKHGITLYYYDVAGNLIKTVSPAGVDQLSVLDDDNDTINAYRMRNEMVNPLVPDHSKVTSYRYNAQNKVIENKTPDGGTTRSYYDMVGRIILSQDERQTPNDQYTYFIYDNLSRVVETGVVQKPGGWDESLIKEPQNSGIFGQFRSQSRNEVTVSIYDTASYTVAGAYQNLPPQEHLKNRVACTKYFEAIDPNVDASADTNFSNALHYSYDLTGNVKTLVHDLRGVVRPVLRIKRVDYEYDLYSGKVIMASYNRGRADQFYQKYTYDADNRIVEVNTSTNGVVWDRDAHYDYYDHGPLARMDLGEQRVQGVDYAYTINGWLKAINGIQNDPQSDMGEDGLYGTVMPKDVFSQRIDYFQGDYKSIADSSFFYGLPAVEKSLYNGNIAGIATALAPFTNLHKKYHYDPLQRIDRAEYADFVFNHNTSQLTTNNLVDYNSEYKYDADGNLLHLRREGGTVSAALNGGTPVAQHNMDQLTYRYEPGTNKLVNLQDSSTSTAYKIDIPHLISDTALAHYTYDGNGNLTKDLVSGLTHIEWNRFGKVKGINKVDGTTIQFTYDPMGNRLAKEVVLYPSADSMVKLKTVYIRDAAGNSLAVYEERKEFDLEAYTPQVLTSDPGIGFPTGNIPAPITHAIAKELWKAQQVNPNANLATIAMGIPQLATYANSSELMQNLVMSLGAEDVVSFLKSVPEITAYTLNVTGNNVELSAEKLYSYLQPLLLSGSLYDEQMTFLTVLKQQNEGLFYTVVEPIPVDFSEKESFPETSTMLDVYLTDMVVEEKLGLIFSLANTLTTEYYEHLAPMLDQLLVLYSPANTAADFVLEVPGYEDLTDEFQTDARDYVSYRYGLVASGAESLDSVAHQFKYNQVLAGAIASQMTPGNVGGLALVINTNMPDVINAAQTNGQIPTLLTSIKNTISAIDMDVLPSTWLATKQILKSDKTHLAEHHLYGSSRIGMQKYLPTLLQVAHAGDLAASTYPSLIQEKPWYSLYGNDLFKPTIFSNALSTTNMGTYEMGIQTHVLGNRHYELTNHLGNVQATILDRTTPVMDVTEGTNILTGYSADISTAQDYYPFGMLMPGRYTSDTSRHCVTMNMIMLVPRPGILHAEPTNATPVGFPQGGSPAPPTPWQLPTATAFTEEVLYVYHWLDASNHPNGWVVQANAVDNGISYTLDLSGEPATGVLAFHHLHMDTNMAQQQVGFNLELGDGFQAQMRVRQYYNNSEDLFYDAVSWQNITTGGAQSLTINVDKNAVANAGKTILEVKFLPPRGQQTFPTGTTPIIDRPWLTNTTLVPENRVVTVCNEKDQYRFGFNGMEKDNEAKGLGNSLDFGARIYDSRLGRFLSLDPLAAKFPYQSPYVFAGNSPIENIDMKGLFKYPKGKEGDAYRAQYPMLTKYLASHIQRDVNKSAMLKREIIEHANNPEFGDKELQSVLRWGDDSRTTITFVDGDRIAHANAQTQSSRSVFINKDYAQAVENVLSDKDREYTQAEKQQAITAFFITMMDETTLAGAKYKANPIISEGGTDGDPGNDLTDKVFYSKDGYEGINRVYQADKDNLKATGEVIKTIKNEDRSDVLPTTPQ